MSAGEFFMSGGRKGSAESEAGEMLTGVSYWNLVASNKRWVYKFCEIDSISSQFLCHVMIHLCHNEVNYVSIQGFFITIAYVINYLGFGEEYALLCTQMTDDSM